MCFLWFTRSYIFVTSVTSSAITLPLIYSTLVIPASLLCFSSQKCQACPSPIAFALAFLSASITDPSDIYMLSSSTFFRSLLKITFSVELLPSPTLSKSSLPSLLYLLLALITIKYAIYFAYIFCFLSVSFTKIQDPWRQKFFFCFIQKTTESPASGARSAVGAHWMLVEWRNKAK